MRTISVEVTVAGDIPAGRHQALLNLKTDDPENPLLRVPLWIQGPAASEIRHASGEGKTITACNTAINLSEMNRVLLIDCDLRRPSIGHLFGLAGNANGLSEMLAGTVDRNACIHRWGKTKLFVLPSGALPPNPLELLSSNEFKSLLGMLSKNFVHIIIDTSPLLPVSDAQLISTLVNGVVFVIKSDATPIPVAIDALKRLRQSNAPLLGGILNQFDAELDLFVLYLNLLQ